jgi:hypothetical protein
MTTEALPLDVDVVVRQVPWWLKMPRLALGNPVTHNSRAGWWEPIVVKSGPMWVNRPSDEMQPPVTPHVLEWPKLRSFRNSPGRLGCLVIGCPLRWLFHVSSPHHPVVSTPINIPKELSSTSNWSQRSAAQNT